MRYVTTITRFPQNGTMCVCFHCDPTMDVATLAIFPGPLYNFAMVYTETLVGRIGDVLCYVVFFFSASCAWKLVTH